MQTLTIEITNDNAMSMLQDLQQRDFIKIISQQDSHVFPGEPFTDEELKRWVEKRETRSSMSLQTAKNQWAKKEKQFLTPGK